MENNLVQTHRKEAEYDAILNQKKKKKNPETKHFIQKRVVYSVRGEPIRRNASRSRPLTSLWHEDQLI